ncbi:Uncharacterised protein [Vibrio cholerae]|nr:Uncharacterised protein [Vibrio cholerae]
MSSFNPNRNHFCLGTATYTYQTANEQLIFMALVNFLYQTPMKFKIVDF